MSQGFASNPTVTLGQLGLTASAAQLNLLTGATNIVVGTANTQTAAHATGSTVLPIDNTIPQNTEGDQYMSLAYTPINASNNLRIEVLINLSPGGTSSYMSAALFQDSIADALAAASVNAPAANQICQVKLDFTVVAGSTSARTYKVRAGSNTAGTTDFNGAGGGGDFNGTYFSNIRITEYTP